MTKRHKPKGKKKGPAVVRRPKNPVKTSNRQANTLRKAKVAGHESAHVPSMKDEALFTGRRGRSQINVSYRKMPIKFVKGGLLFGLEMSSENTVDKKEPEGDFIREFEQALGSIPLDEDDEAYMGETYQEIVRSETKNEPVAVDLALDGDVAEEIAEEIAEETVEDLSTPISGSVEDVDTYNTSVLADGDAAEVSSVDGEGSVHRDAEYETASPVHASNSLSESFHDLSGSNVVSSAVEAANGSITEVFRTDENRDKSEYSDSEKVVQSIYDSGEEDENDDDDDEDEDDEDEDEDEEIAIYEDAGTETDSDSDDATYSRLENLSLYELGGLDNEVNLGGSDDDFDFSITKSNQIDSSNSDDDILSDVEPIDLPITQIWGTRVSADDTHLLIEWSPDFMLYNADDKYQYYPKTQIYDMFTEFGFSEKQIDLCLATKGALTDDDPDDTGDYLGAYDEIGPLKKLGNDFSLLATDDEDSDSDVSLDYKLKQHKVPEDVYDMQLMEALTSVQREVKDARAKTRESKKAKRRARELMHMENRLTKRGKKKFSATDSPVMDLYPVFKKNMTSSNVIEQIELFLGMPEKTSLHFPPFQPKSNLVVRDFCLAYNLNAFIQGSANSPYSVLASKTKHTGFAADRDEDSITRLLWKRKNHRRADTANKHIQSNGPGYALSDLLGEDQSERLFGMPEIVMTKSKPDRSRNHGIQKLKEGDLVGGHASEIGSDNVGHRLLSKMGWIQGSGLGTGEGIKEPIHAVVRTSKIGLGANA